MALTVRCAYLVSPCHQPGPLCLLVGWWLLWRQPSCRWTRRPTSGRACPWSHLRCSCQQLARCCRSPWWCERWRERLGGRPWTEGLLRLAEIWFGNLSTPQIAMWTRRLESIKQMPVVLFHWLYSILRCCHDARAHTCTTVRRAMRAPWRAPWRRCPAVAPRGATAHAAGSDTLRLPFYCTAPAHTTESPPLDLPSSTQPRQFHTSPTRSSRTDMSARGCLGGGTPRRFRG